METVPIMAAALSVAIARLRMAKDTETNLIWEEKVKHTETKECCLGLVRCVSDIK